MLVKLDFKNLIVFVFSRDLDRLAKLLSSRQKEQKAKTQGWGTFSSHEIWKQLLNETRKAGRDHAALAEIYNSAITSRCNQLNDDITRIFKKVSLRIC